MQSISIYSNFLYKSFLSFVDQKTFSNGVNISTKMLAMVLLGKGLNRKSMQFSTKRADWLVLKLYVIKILDNLPFNLRATHTSWMYLFHLNVLNLNMDDFIGHVFLDGEEWRGTSRMKDRLVVWFLFSTVNFNDPSHTPFTQPLLLTQDRLIYRSQDTGAVYTTDTSLSVSRVWENHAQCRKLSDRCLLWVWHSFSCLILSDLTHVAYTRRHMEVLSLVCLCACLCCLWVWAHAIGSHVGRPLSAHEAEWIIERTGQGEVLLKWI